MPCLYTLTIIIQTRHALSLHLKHVSKTKTTFIFQNCGAQSPKWIGKCNSCGEWNTFLEEIVTERKNTSTLQVKGNLKPLLLSEIDLDQQSRIVTGNEEFDRVIGGGIVPGGLILLGGEPGIGKSTLVLQIALQLTKLRVLYISGEESLQQLKMRANRLNGKQSDCLFLCETSLENILSHLETEKPDLVIIDSIQTDRKSTRLN